MPRLVAFIETQIEIAKEKEFAPEEKKFPLPGLDAATPKEEEPSIITKIGNFLKGLFR